MAANFSDIAIRIGAIADLKGFKVVSKATQKLEKQVKSLGHSFGVAFGGAALAYGIKTTIKNFADAEREAQALTNTVKNLGLEFANQDIKNYVAQIGRLYGVTGGEAIPALQALITATGSASKSFDIFNAALDLSASRGTDITQTAKDLAQAYVGNTKSLKSYNLGLTNAELAAMSFSDVLATITEQTKGSAAEAANTFSGQMRVLSETSNQAKEAIGKSLVEALGSLSGEQGAGGAAKVITTLGNAISSTVTGVAYLVKKLEWAKPIIVGVGLAVMAAWAPWFTAITAAVAAIGWIGNKLKGKTIDTSKIGTGKSYFQVQAERAKALKAELTAAARAKKLENDKLAALKKQTAEKRAQAALDKAANALNAASNVFDLERIQVAAAMQNQTLTANEMKRLEIKQAIFALQDAIDSKDTARITKQTDILNGLLGQFATMQKQDTLLGQIKFSLESLGVNKDLINLLNLQEALRLLQEMSKITINGAKVGGTTTGTGGGAGGGGAGGGAGGGGGIGPFIAGFDPNVLGSTDYGGNVIGSAVPASVAKVMDIFMTEEQARLNALNIQQQQYAAQAQGLAAKYGGYVTVNIAGDLQKLIDSITYETQNASANGTPIMLDRNATNLAW